MVETLTFLIMVFFTLQTHSMVPTCYLQRMPLDIQNHIASFLIEFESKTPDMMLKMFKGERNEKEKE